MSKGHWLKAVERVCYPASPSSITAPTVTLLVSLIRMAPPLKRFWMYGSKAQQKKTGSSGFIVEYDVIPFWVKEYLFVCPRLAFQYELMY